MDWWIIGAIVYLVLAFWGWCIVRVGAKADEDWDRIVAKLDQEERDRRAHEGA